MTKIPCEEDVPRTWIRMCNGPTNNIHTLEIVAYVLFDAHLVLWDYTRLCARKSFDAGICDDEVIAARLVLFLVRLSF
jgi:hypothetical protein